MSEHITHIAVYEDCTRIMKFSREKFTKAFHEAIDAAYDCGMFCSGSRGNHLYAIPILEKNRDLYGTNKYGQNEIEQVAGAIGWLTHRASDLEMKPMFKKITALENPMLISNEGQMYHDAVSFKEVYQGGKINTKSPYEHVDESLLARQMETNPAGKHIEVDYFENLMAHYYVARMVDQCKFTGKMDDVNEFAEKLVDYSQDLYEDLRMYIRAYNNPEPYKMQGYIHNFNIYNPEDSLIRFVRYVQQNGREHPSINLETALEDSKGQSHYARALRRGYDYVGALSAFFDKKISREEVIERCEI
ncbi:MAG: hypothetical protein ACOCUP_02495 [bacterium]